MEIKQKKVNTKEEKIKEAFETAFKRELLGIDFEMNMNSLEQDLEEIKNPVESKGKKND